MSKKIKNPKTPDKVSGKIVEKPPLITVSFQYLSTNKSRNFEFFGHKDLRRKTDALEQLFSFLQRLTSKSRADISNIARDRDCGYEILEPTTVNCAPTGYRLTKSDQIAVFRFGNNSAGGDYRLLGLFEERSPVLNIIGFDFDYSAYPHD